MRRPLLLVLWVLEVWVALTVALLAAFWLWSGSEGSLNTSLQWAARALPAGDRLVAHDVRGSLRGGGHLGQLRWEHQGLTVQAREVEIEWKPAQLLAGLVRVDRVHVAELHIDDRSPPSSAPLTELLLPVPVDVTLAADAVWWGTDPRLRATGVAGSYKYDGVQHHLMIDKALFAQGRYRAQAQLLARAPLTLDLDLSGTVQAAVAGRNVALDASASLHGPLAGTQPELQLQGQVRPVQAPGTGQPTAAQAMRATVSGRLAPWAPQPVLAAQAEFQRLDLALLWPGAPQTLLTGSAQVQPRGSDWQAQLKLDNALAAPWDTHHLPVRQAQAQLAYRQGNWNIESLQADSAGGRIDVQAQLGDAAHLQVLSGWEGRARLEGINPALLHSRLAPARLSGSVEAAARGNTVQFVAALRTVGPQPAVSPLAGLRLQAASTTGKWADGWLHLQELSVQSDEAALQGQVDLQLANRNLRGQLHLVFPGGQARFNGQLAPREGTGDLALDVTDATRALRWASRQPQAPALLARLDLSGRADVALHWQGGWQALQRDQAAPLTLQLDARIPALEFGSAGEPASQHLRLQDARLSLSGPLASMALSTSGNAIQGTRRFGLQAAGSGGQLVSGDWQLALQTLALRIDDSQIRSPWALVLRQPMNVGWQAGSGTLRTSAGLAALTGPLPGEATLESQPLLWTTGAGGTLTSQGRIRGIAMEWLALLGGLQLANLGLSGDMVFDADWDLAAGDALRLRASLMRRAGDIRVLGGTPPGTAAAAVPANAGVREARATITIDGDVLMASARWDSERAGNAQADVSTRLARGPAGWDWPASATLRGAVVARMPQVGVWSVLAPPGWRMRGTLDASLQLAGTREAPQWSGTLQADDLALRSVVEGIEFGNGRLRASMQGQRLSIQEFTLQGAGSGGAGGTLTATGFAVWLPAGDGNAGKALSRVQIDLDAAASNLRVSARADRRLVVSGTLQARLRNTRLGVQGALKADHASIVLPDQNAPQLGDDVVVRGRSPAATHTSTSAAGTPVETTITLALDLGPDFQLQGRGITTRLAGTLQLRSNATDPPRLNGEVRTVQGNYKAYGQLLDIEQGVMRFTGAYDNPALDILALRPNLTQRVGVQVTGTALVPRVRLYAEPELPEAEKLAWLVLGRSGANGGAEAAVLQQAAMALLGRNGQGLSGGIAGALGLDELSFAGAATKADGSTSAATVTLGKRLSRDVYVAYERSLAGTLGTISIFYDLSRRFTLRARTGEQSAVDLIFTISYD